MMFASVYYIIDKHIAKVPVGYIKNFNPQNYDASSTYKVFWSRNIHTIQNEEDEDCMAKLKNLMKEPPSKSSWKTAEGEGYYLAFILRVEDSLEDLIDSLRKKRPNVPFTNECDEVISTTEDEGAVSVHLQKSRKKKQEAEIKKFEQAAKKMKSEQIFKAARRINQKKFKDIDGCGSMGSDNDSDDDPEVIPDTKYRLLKNAYDALEKEKEEVYKKFEDAQEKLKKLQKEHEEGKVICEEVIHLRELNRQLQEKILKGGCIHAACITEVDSEVAGETETMEVDLGAGIRINRSVYKEINDLNHIRKFTKSLAVAIWGTNVLAGRSVKGRPCRNKNGPKKITPIPEETVVQQDSKNSQNDSKPPLTPEKLSVITGQMREYMLKRGRSLPEIEAELKNRNKYISDKIMDICSNLARAEARSKQMP